MESSSRKPRLQLREESLDLLDSVKANKQNISPKQSQMGGKEDATLRKIKVPTGTKRGSLD